VTIRSLLADKATKGTRSGDTEPRFSASQRGNEDCNRPLEPKGRIQAVNATLLQIPEQGF